MPDLPTYPKIGRHMWMLPNGFFWANLLLKGRLVQYCCCTGSSEKANKIKPINLSSVLQIRYESKKNSFKISLSKMAVDSNHMFHWFCFHIGSNSQVRIITLTKEFCRAPSCDEF